MLVTNPRIWAKNAVGSWWRFGLLAVLLTWLTVFSIFVAAESGFRSGLSVAVAPVMFQLLFLYALRRMYRQATGAEAAGRDD